MIINVTDEQKKIIESQGYMVIQYKKWCIDMQPHFQRLYNACMDFKERVILFFQDMFIRLNRFADNMIGTLIRITDKIKESYARMKDDDSYFEEKEKFPFVHSLGTKYRPNIKNRVIYHRCRDRC